MTAYHLAEGALGLPTVAQLLLYLPHQIPLAGFLLMALLVLDHLLQIGHGFLIVLRADIVVGVGVVPVLHGAEVDGVAAHIADHVLGIVEPVEFCVALGEPGTGQTVLHNLRLVDVAHITEGGGGLVEVTLLELRLAQQHPRFPDEGVVLPTPQPLTVLGRLAPSTLPLGFGFDAVATDGLFGFLDGAVVLALAYVAAGLVAHGVEGNLLREVVLVTLLLLQIAVNEGLVTIKIGIIACIEGVPPA